MINKKVAMLGSWGVGKTSLVRQFVENVFDDHYLSTLGVKIDKKVLTVKQGKVETQLSLMLWDVAGSENDFSVPLHYIKGAAALILVVDRARKESLSAAIELLAQIEQGIGEMPFIVMANKSDLDWQLSNEEIDEAFPGKDSSDSVLWFSTSAKTGENVEVAFSEIAKRCL